MRLAWFTPLPPVRSGISDYSAEILPLLAADHAIDVFVATAAERADRPGVAVYSAHDFVWRHRRRPYDLIVYQLGNARCHDYMWAYLAHYPGLLVLHDAALHHARAALLLRDEREADYRAELAANHPDLDPSVAEIAIGGVSGPLYYFWPMVAVPARASRAVAVHNSRLARSLASDLDGRSVEVIRMGVADRAATDDEAAAVRRRHNVPDEAVLLGMFGGVTPEKRVAEVLGALALARRHHANVRLMLVGGAHPHFDAQAAAEVAGVDDLVIRTGYVPDTALSAYLAAVDVALCLRWPTTRETSATWLRAIAAGRATVVTALEHLVEVPTLDPRDWRVVDANPTLTPREPLAVSIDMRDEQHSIGLALKRLLGDRPLRERLGRAARRYWEDHHTLALMAEDYARVLATSARAPLPARGALPAHWRADGLEHARALVAPFGLAPFEDGPGGSAARRSPQRSADAR